MKEEVQKRIAATQQSQIDKKKKAEKSRTDMIAETFSSEEDNESYNKSSYESKNEPNNKTANTKSDDISAKDLLKLLEPQAKKEKKEKANIYLKKDTMDKLRTLSIQKDKGITAIVEELLDIILKDVEIDEASVRKYKRMNKVRSNKSKKED